MEPLPAADLRSNLGTWAVRVAQLPAVAHFMHDELPNESYDPHFHGQTLITTYFDTAKMELRKNRHKHAKYITVRVRCYNNEQGESYALSVKTEASKFRVEIPSDTADRILSGRDALPALAALLPSDLLARLLDVSHEQALQPVVSITCRRYAIEDDKQRFTLDTEIYTDLGKVLPYSILEFKSTRKEEPPLALGGIGLQPTKMSKFLWGTMP